MKIVPNIPPEVEITNLLYKYNIFVNGFLLSPTKKILTKELCKDHRAIHELYHTLREKDNKYDFQFEYIHYNFVRELVELYDKGKLTIDTDLMKAKQIQEMFNIRKIEAL